MTDKTPLDELDSLFRFMGVSNASSRKVGAIFQIIQALPELGLADLVRPQERSPETRAPSPVQETAKPDDAKILREVKGDEASRILCEAKDAVGLGDSEQTIMTPGIAETQDKMQSAPEKVASGMVYLNGEGFPITGPGNIVIAGRRVVIDGVDQNVKFSSDPDLLKIEVASGTVVNLIANAKTVNANVVSGNAAIVGDASIGSVAGNADINGDVSVGNIGGNLEANGDVTAKNVGGSLRAEGDIKIG